MTNREASGYLFAPIDTTAVWNMREVQPGDIADDMGAAILHESLADGSRDVRVLELPSKEYVKIDISKDNI